MHVRYKLGKLDRVIPVISQGVSQPGNILVMQWTEDSLQAGGAPADSQEVQCQMLHAGVLYLAKGQVCGSSSGRLPRVRVRVSDHCVGMKLRSQQRYAVRGKLEILEPGGAVGFAHQSFQKMNISLGGFGTNLPEGEIPKQSTISFRIELYVEEDSQAKRDTPPLNLEGKAELRHTQPSSHPSYIYAGFSFDQFGETEQAVLLSWIATNHNDLKPL